VKNLIKRMVEEESGLLSRFSANHGYELFTTEEKRQKHILDWAKKHTNQKDFCERFFKIREDIFNRKYYYVKYNSVICPLADLKMNAYPVIGDKVVYVKRSECKTCQYIIVSGRKRYCKMWREKNNGNFLKALSNAVNDTNKIFNRGA
jgi:hypothetical protein